MNVQQFIGQSGRTCELLPHTVTFTAQRTAQAVHVPGNAMAKSVVLQVDGEPVLAVVPATHRVDPDKVRKILGADAVELADEADLPRLFPDCELGAVPPFGSQYGMKTLVDEALARDERIVIESNSLESAIRMRYDDYTALERPLVADISHRE